MLRNKSPIFQNFRFFFWRLSTYRTTLVLNNQYLSSLCLSLQIIKGLSWLSSDHSNWISFRSCKRYNDLKIMDFRQTYLKLFCSVLRARQMVGLYFSVFFGFDAARLFQGLGEDLLKRSSGLFSVAAHQLALKTFWGQLANMLGCWGKHSPVCCFIELLRCIIVLL